MSDLKHEVARIENRAEDLQALLPYAPRAFVIEFAGTPKSGKSTSVEAIRHFFSRHGFRVHVLSERAAMCPIPMKGHLFFNMWCATSMLAELLANVEAETDIIIVDRGLFDALVWLTLQEKRGELTTDEARDIESFILLERWRTLIDVAVVMSVSAQEALSRENSQRITRKGGSIMNPEVLAGITDSVSEAIERYGDRFAAVIDYKTTGMEIRESNIRLVQQVLEHFERFVNPEVLVVPKKQIKTLPLKQGGAFYEGATEKALDCIASHGRFMRRAEAEEKSDYIQIIPCGLLTYEDQVFLFIRKETDPKYRLYGRTTIWQGCHVTKRDGVVGPEFLKTALMERVSRSLFLSRVFPMEDLGYCWDREDPRTGRHFGVVYRICIDNPHTAVDLKKKEFRRRRGYGLTGEFRNPQELASNQDEIYLESWSRAILKGIGG